MLKSMRLVLTEKKKKMISLLFAPSFIIFFYLNAMKVLMCFVKMMVAHLVQMMIMSQIDLLVKPRTKMQGVINSRDIGTKHSWNA